MRAVWTDKLVQKNLEVYVAFASVMAGFAIVGLLEQVRGHAVGSYVFTAAIAAGFTAVGFIFIQMRRSDRFERNRKSIARSKHGG